MSILRRKKMSGALIGSLAGLAAALLALPIMMDEFTLVFWLTLGLASGGGIGFIGDTLAAKRPVKADGIDGKPRGSGDSATSVDDHASSN